MIDVSVSHASKVDSTKLMMTIKKVKTRILMIRFQRMNGLWQNLWEKKQQNKLLLVK